MWESSAVDEVLEGDRSTSRQWVILGLLVFVYAGLGLLLTPARFSDGPHDIILPLVMGFLFSQPMLLAFWAAFAPQRFYHRVLWGLLLCTVVALAAEGERLFAGEQTAFGQGGGFPRGFFLSMDLILFGVATPLLLLVRRLTRWRLTQFAAEPASSGYQAHQFGIKHLLVLTAIAALVCSLFRSLMVTDSTVSVQPIAEVAKVVFQIVVVFLPIGLIPWLTLGYHKPIVTWLLIAIVMVWASDTACYAFFRIPQGSGQIQAILLVQLGGGLSVLVSTLVIRWCGYRMIRQARA